MSTRVTATNLITGGTGFVGRYLTRELLSRGERCRLLVRADSDTREFRDRENVEIRIGDICAAETLAGIAEGVQHVYHLAACGHVAAQSEEAYRNFVRINVDGTKNLLSACAAGTVQKFVHFSSTAAMGLIKKDLVDESDAPAPVTPYQRSKLESERVALSQGATLAIPTVVVRPCMIYGVGGEGEFKKISRLMRRGLFPRVGRGKNLTPLVHVADVVQGAIKAAELGSPGQVYLLAAPRSIELEQMRKLVMSAWGHGAPRPYVPVWAMFGIAGLFEWWAKLRDTTPMATRRNVASTVWDREFSIDKARRELGYEPSVSFERGIGETVAWFKETG